MDGEKLCHIAFLIIRCCIKYFYGLNYIMNKGRLKFSDGLYQRSARILTAGFTAFE
ncbi:hypothetical protein l13_04150 [Neisseria weaveri ATCC 51223]|nr:hypothetical protein l13_04150 [Neisseria weaveri ATCC 51223]